MIFNNTKWSTKNISIFFSSNPGPNFSPSSNRLDTGEKLIITSSVTKDVYNTTLHFTNQAPYSKIYALSVVYLPLLWWLATGFFKHNWWLKRLLAPRKERGYHYVKCVSPLRFCPLLSWKLKKSKFTTPISPKFVLFF